MDLLKISYYEQWTILHGRLMRNSQGRWLLGWTHTSSKNFR